MPRVTREYPDDLKAEVIAAWKSGDSLTQLMARFDVPKTTVRGWVAGLTRLSRASVAPKKKSSGASEASASEAPADDATSTAVVVSAPVLPLEPSGETIDDIAWDHVRAGDLATRAILRKVTDPDWLDRQDAGAVAILYGVLADKQIRLLAAFRSVEDSGAARAEQPVQPERAGDAAQPEVG